MMTSALGWCCAVLGVAMLLPPWPGPLLDSPHAGSRVRATAALISESPPHTVLMLHSAEAAVDGEGMLSSRPTATLRASSPPRSTAVDFLASVSQVGISR